MSVALNQINALDPASLNALKRLARDGNSQEGLRQAAQQLEGVFMQMVLKAMREATPFDGLFDSDQTRMLQGMHDQQMAMEMAQGRGVGLADLIFRQLGGKAEPNATPQAGLDAAPVFDLASVPRRPAIPAFRQPGAENAAVETAAAAALGGALAAPLATTASAASPMAPVASLVLSPAAPRAAASPSVALPSIESRPAQDGVGTPAASGAAAAAASARAGSAPATQRPASDAPAHVRSFVERVWPHAQQASGKLGIPAQFLVAQSALETGWGRGELRLADGTPSHNLFNIKAGRNWQGPVVELPVTEYANGRAYTEAARFRAYGSYEEAFEDYVRLLQNSPRYADVLDQQDAAGFARSLQSAGFATDPEYANKVARIIGGESLQAAIADKLV